MTNVLILAPKYPPHTGGAAVYFEQVTRLLESTDYDVTVFAPRHPDREYKTREHGAIVYRAFPETGAPFYTGLTEMDRFRWLVRRVDPDIAHVHPHFPQYRWFRFLLKWYNIPRIYDCRDKTFNRRYVSDGESYLAVSPAVRELLQIECGVPADRIALAPVVMPDIDPEPVAVDSGEHVAFVGDLESHKGVLLAVASVSQIANDRDVTLHVAGTGTLQDWIQTEAESDYLQYHGELPHPKAVGLLDAVDALVLPAECEGSPRVVREALSVGTPVVTTDVGDLPRLLDNAGYIADRTVPAIARGLQTVLTDETYSECAAKQSATTSTAELRRSIVNAYDSVID